MRPDGHREIISVWREAGEWWSMEPYREFVQYLDSKGIRREESYELPSIANLIQSGQRDYDHDCSEDISVKASKTRDEKVSRACGTLSHDYYQEKTEEFQLLRDARLTRQSKSLYPFGKKLQEPHSQTKVIASAVKASAAPYVPLHIASGYTFGRGTMLAEEIPLVCASFGIPAAAITDCMSLTGAVEFVKTCKKQGIKPLVGATVVMPEGGELVLIAKSKRGYESLSQLITQCHLEEPRQFPLCSWNRLERFSRDLLCLTGGDTGPLNRLITSRRFAQGKELIERLISIFGRGNVFVEIERTYLPWQISTNRLLIDLAKELDLTCFAGGLVTHPRRADFPIGDILTCVETLCTVEEVLGRKPKRHPDQPQISPIPDRALNAERFLRRLEEMGELYADEPELLANTVLIAEKCDDEVLPDRTQLPKLFDDDNRALREITWMGAHQHHKNIDLKLQRRINSELDRIQKLGFSGHFLVAWDMVKWAQEQQIHHSGRGSVVDSAVAYCLGFSRIDAYKHQLHFDRFLPIDGTKRPDIDIDFEAHRRDDVREYLTRKYGRDRVATVAAVGAYCTRGIVREVGKALGLPNETIGYLAKKIHGGVPADQLESALMERPELRGSQIPRERFRIIFQLAQKLMDIPRNMRAHSSGVVISSRPLAETVPVMWSASSPRLAEGESAEHIRIIQWDKRSCKYFFDKFDVLCLRGQDVLSGTERRVRINSPDFNVNRLSTDDEETYRAMRSGELIGIPQSASPAMRQAHIRIETKNLHDASLVQAGIRPGVGGAVKINQLIARRRGKESFTYPHPELERILGNTYGIIVFQEQVDQLLQSFCGYSSGEAEDLRDNIYKKRREDFGKSVRETLFATMIERGHGEQIAAQVTEYILGFNGYGFAQGHALAFAEITVRSIYCQQNHPAEYFASLLSAQPAGYYGPCTISNEARNRGVVMLSPDVNASEEEFTVEQIVDRGLTVPGGAIRIGLKQVAGLSEQTRKRIVGTAKTQATIAREEVPLRSVQYEGSGVQLMVAEGGKSYQREKPVSRRFKSIFDFTSRVKPDRDELELLILCGAFDSLHPNRRALLWAIPSAMDYANQLDEGCLPLEMPEPLIPSQIEDFNSPEKALHERRILDLDVADHLMAYERERISSRGGITSESAKRLAPGKKAICVGNPIRLRFPPTASGKRVVFFDLEDETGLLNVTCFDDVYRRDGHAIVCSPYVTIIGEAQDRDGHTAFLAHRVFPYQPQILKQVQEERLPITTADFLVG